jgi:hypothetical protein
MSISSTGLSKHERKRRGHRPKKVQKAPTPDSLLLTRNQTCALLNISRSGVIRLEQAGLLHELSSKVGDGGNREGGISWGCLTPPLLHQRSDMPCPTITLSS